jgi:hypothetical protein
MTFDQHDSFFGVKPLRQHHGAAPIEEQFEIVPCARVE